VFFFGSALVRACGRGRDTSRARIDRAVPTTAGVGTLVRPEVLSVVMLEPPFRSS
jgi:hypothetical protein